MVLFTPTIFKLIYECHQCHDTERIDNITDQLSLAIDDIVSGNDDLTTSITHNNNITHTNILIKEIFDSMWVSLGLSGYIINDNNDNTNFDNYVLSKEGIYFFFKCFFRSIFTDRIFNTKGVIQLLMRVVENKWQSLSSHFNTTNAVSIVNIFIFYHIILEAADNVFMFLQPQYKSSFLWILFNNIVDVGNGGNCRAVNDIRCILDVEMNIESNLLSLSLTPDMYKIAMEYEKVRQDMSRTDHRRPATAINQFRDSGMSFRSVLTNLQTSSNRPASASIAIIPTTITTTQNDTIGQTKWQKLKDLLGRRKMAGEAGNQLETTFIDEWNPVITASLSADLERQRQWKTIKRPNSSQTLTRPKSSPSPRPTLDFEVIQITGERKPVYKIIENIDVDQASKHTTTTINNEGDGGSVNIEDITEKLMASMSDKQEQSIEFATDIRVYGGGQLVAVEDFLFKPEVFSLKQPNCPPNDLDLSHFASFLNEQQQIKSNDTSPQNGSKNNNNSNNNTNIQVNNVTQIHHIGFMHANKSDISLLHNLSVEGGLSLSFVPSPSMYSNAMIDANVSFNDSNELFSPHGGSYLETNVDPAMKQPDTVNNNQASSIIGTYKYKLEQNNEKAIRTNGALEISGRCSPVLSKDQPKYFTFPSDDYGSIITDSSIGSPNDKRILITDANLTMLDNTMDDIENHLDDVDQNYVSPVSSIIMKNIGSDMRDKVLEPVFASSTASVNTLAALLETNTKLFTRTNLVCLDPVRGEKLSMIPIIDTSLNVHRKELKSRESKHPSLVTKLRNNISNKINGVGNLSDKKNGQITSKFINDSKYPLINALNTRNPWKPICYNMYVDPLLNGAPMTWEERKLSQTYLQGDVNHMVMSVKIQSASRAAFEQYADTNTPKMVKYKRYLSEPKGLHGQKKLLVKPGNRHNTSDTNMKPIKIVKDTKVAVVIPAAAPVPIVPRRMAFIQSKQSPNLLIPRVFQPTPTNP